jgi:hypothetical protein
VLQLQTCSAEYETGRRKGIWRPGRAFESSASQLTSRKLILCARINKNSAFIISELVHMIKENNIILTVQCQCTLWTVCVRKERTLQFGRLFRQEPSCFVRFLSSAFRVWYFAPVFYITDMMPRLLKDCFNVGGRLPLTCQFCVSSVELLCVDIFPCHS